MHAFQLLCDGVQWAVLLLRESLDPSDLGKKLADFLFYVIAILLGHDYTRLQARSWGIRI